MADYRFKISPIPVSELEAFREASAEELRVLIAIQDRFGIFSDSDIIELAGVSKARFLSSLALWQEAGALIRVMSGDENCVISEFSTDTLAEDFYEESAEELAKDIREGELCGMFNEIQNLVGKGQLSPMEVKYLTVLYSQYALSTEYILLLASYLSDKGSLTIHKLFHRAKTLSVNGVDTVDELEDYIKKSERATSIHSQVKHLFGIFNKNLNKKERDYISRWNEKYGYDMPIITAAFDLLPAGARLNFAYIDKILTDWYDHRCTTVAECEARHQAYLDERDKAKSGGNTAGIASERRSVKKTTPRFGDFDPEEAFKRALARTYGDKESPNGDDKK